MCLRACLLALALPLVVACGGEAQDPEPQIAEPQTAEVTSRWVGAWTSPPCGERWFERRIELRPEGQFSGEDRVSPCLPGMQCMWSGVVYWSGTWVADGDRAVLHEESAGPMPGPAEAPRPKALVWDPRIAAPVEETPEGERCPYLEMDDVPSIPASEEP